MEKAAFKAFVSGLVQGVGYRYFVYRKAAQYEITGYVKNLFDGRVEVFAEGNKKDLEEFLAELWKGPQFARVENVQVEWLEYEQKYPRFYIETGYDY
ncbi:MAG: acylphosphatase [Calditrichia bacterium]